MIGQATRTLPRWLCQWNTKGREWVAECLVELDRQLRGLQDW
jgi:hypothetical protein